MSRITVLQTADYWVSAGGPRGRAVEWVAIAIGESGLDTTIVSPAGAIGLWQIMPFNAAPNGFSVAQLYDAWANARVAVMMSGGGANCAAWDSAYRDIYASGRYTFLAYPEPGSADAGNIPIVAAELAGQGLGSIPPRPPAPASDPLPGAVRQLQSIGGHQVPAITGRAAALARYARTVGTGGWRP